ncbi:MAG: helix-turn-helix transcriptional regulator [Saprospiraceae bacterium]|nr:helix-turn-helix transcriptional regulator [Saprospiraceae bacterium]
MVKQTRHAALLKALGKRLRALRQERRLSQETLAWKADLELSQISRIERGVINTSISQLFSIAEALNVSLADLFTFEIPDED